MISVKGLWSKKENRTEARGMLRESAFTGSTEVAEGKEDRVAVGGSGLEKEGGPPLAETKRKAENGNGQRKVCDCKGQVYK